MLMLILVVLLIASLAGGGLGYKRWGAGGLSPALLIGLVLVVMLLSGRI